MNRERLIFAILILLNSAAIGINVGAENYGIAASLAVLTAFLCAIVASGEV